MITVLATSFGTYYVLCSGFIYIKAGTWTKRPKNISGTDDDNNSSDNYASLEDNERGGGDEAVSPPTLQRRMSIFKRLGHKEENPFYNKSWRLNETDRLKMTLLGPILIPIRFVGLLTTALLACLLSTVAVAGLPRENFECGSTKPLSWWRRAIRLPVLFLARCMIFFLGYVYLEEVGRPARLEDAPIVIANHLGPIEPMILGVRLGGMPVSRLENASIPLFGALCKAFLPIFVDRNDPNSRTAVKDEIESRAKGAAAGKYGGPVFLFPEGTTTNGSSVITFKSGAFQPRLPVQPAIVEFPHKFGQIYPSWTVVSPSLPELMIRLLCEPFNRCKITWLPPVTPLEEEMSEWPGPKLYAKRVQGIVAQALDSETTQFAFEDVRLMHEARKFGDKYSALATGGAAVEFKRLKEELVDMDLDDAKRYLETFHKLDKTDNGELSFEEFREAYADRMPDDLLQQMFDLLDDDCSGRLDFREFLVGACLLNSSSDKTLDDALKFSFRIFDVKKEGRMDFPGAHRILRVIYPDTSEASLRKAFDEMDANGNGFLDEEEFVTFAKKHEETLPNIKKLLIV